MINIISERKDITTDKVIKWLLYFKLPFNRLNFEHFTAFSIKINNEDNLKITLNNQNTSKNIFWNRRARLQFLSKEVLNSQLRNYIRKEELPIVLFVDKFLKVNSQLTGSYVDEMLNNKIENLKIAVECGLKIPNTIITNQKKDLEEFFKKNNARIMSKVIYINPNYENNDYLFTLGTNKLVTKSQVEKMPLVFAPSIIQGYIDKKFEVRVFVFNKLLYSMAIFSQRDKLTKFDFRNYNKSKPNRVVPFKLTNTIKNKILNFLHVVKIETGSIDIIVDKNNDFIFLEINPQGQLDWLSLNCNYNIEMIIANFFKSKFKEDGDK